MGQDPDTIREQVEQTRERMGDTVDALAYKADVKTRAKESVTGRIDDIKEKVTGATPSTGDVKHGARRAAGIAQENPIGLAIGGLAVGFLAGMLIPSTRVEDERIGPMADQVKERAAQTGQQALEHGKEVAGDVAQAATETARDSGREHAEQAKEEVKQTAQQTREDVSR
jgi:gas vesicle protein